MSTATLTDELKELDYGHRKDHRARLSLDRELAFTEAYRRHEHAPALEREIACMRVHVAHSLQPIQDGDWFAGRIDRPLVGLDPERGGLTEAAYYCRSEDLERELADKSCPPALAAHLRSLLDYWTPRQTSVHCRAAFSAQTRRVLPGDDYYTAREIGYPMYGLGGPCPNYDRLLREGIPGLRAAVGARRASATPAEEPFLRSLDSALDILVDAARRYAAQARGLASTGARCGERLERVARSLEAVVNHAPHSYHEAAQLLWLYAIVALPRNYGRLDVSLGDFLARDLDSGTLTVAEARAITAGLWRMMVARGDNFNNRIIVGGRGRRNEANADRFALLAMQTQRDVCDIIPQLSLRWYDGMPAQLWDEAMETIGAGATFPILYNDDVNVPAIAEALRVPVAEAEQYVPYGCGEFVLEGMSVGSPDAALNVAKALDVVLHDGLDSFFNEPRGMAQGGLCAYATFDDLKRAFRDELAVQIAALAEAQAKVYAVTATQAAYPLLSLLFDDCVEHACPLLAGGVRYCTGLLESFGNNTAADSLYAIKRAVYDTGAISPARLLECLRGDFEGAESERRLLAGIAKYGNDNHEADELSLWVNRIVGELCMQEAARVGLHSFQMVLVNNGDSVLFGKTTGATPDGRRRGQPVSNGNQPSAGADHSGLTALLNSMAKLSPVLHAGATHNVKVSRGVFSARRPQVRALLQAYFARGGTQAMLTVTDHRELEAALEHPEEYANLIVRVGGYSERFVDLPREIQLEVVRRTLHGG